MRLRTFLLAAGALALSAGAAGAATVTNDLNLRTGPGTGYRVITVYYAPPTTVFRLGFGTGPRWHHRGWRGGHRSHHNRGHHRGGHHRRH